MASFVGAMVYLSIFRRSRFIPGTVSTRPSQEALIWNSLKRQAITHPVVALESPTWSLTMTGVLMELPTKVAQIMSKSVSKGEAELQIGTLIWTSTDWVTVSIDDWFLSQIEPYDLPFLGVNLPGDLLQDVLDPSNGWLACGVDLVTRNAVEVRGSNHRVRKLLDLVEMVRHGRGLPYLWIIRHDGEP